MIFRYLKQGGVDKIYDDNILIVAKNIDAASYSTCVNQTFLHFLLETKNIIQEKGNINLDIISLCYEAFCDSFAQRINLFLKETFEYLKNITFNLTINPHSRFLNNEDIDHKIISEKRIIHDSEIISCDTSYLYIRLQVNLDYCYTHFVNSVDASFQVEICQEILQLLNEYIVIKNCEQIITSLDSTRTRQLRMLMRKEEQAFDIMKTDTSIDLMFYKKAKNQLSSLLKQKNIPVGQHNNPQEIKVILNQLSAEFREIVHQNIQNISQEQLLAITLTYYNGLITKHDLKYRQQLLSKKHQITYDRAGLLTKNTKDLVDNSNDARYVIEACLMLNSTSENKVSEEQIYELFGQAH